MRTKPRLATSSFTRSSPRSSPGRLQPDDSLFALGVIDSLAMVKTIPCCEEPYEIEIPDEELIRENFDTVCAIADLIERLCADK